MGSDHFPILSRFRRRLTVEKMGTASRLDYTTADWEKFCGSCDKDVGWVDSEGDVEGWNRSICGMLMGAAGGSILKKEGFKRRKIVPWWNKDCDAAVRARNKAYRRLRKCPVVANWVEYKRLRAVARRVIKEAKRERWRKFCGTLGPDTPVTQVWDIVQRMSGCIRSQPCWSWLRKVIRPLII